MQFEEKTIVDIREQMVVADLSEWATVSEVAELFGVSPPTVHLWRDRYRREGRSGLSDRSHATQSCPDRTDEAIEELIVKERQRWGWGTEPAELTTIDYKGHFRLWDGRYCYPLTLLDSVSRYLLACEACRRPVCAVRGR